MNKGKPLLRLCEEKEEELPPVGSSTNNPLPKRLYSKKELKKWDEKLKILSLRVKREETKKRAYLWHLETKGKIPPITDAYDIFYDYNNGQIVDKYDGSD